MKYDSSFHAHRINIITLGNKILESKKKKKTILKIIYILPESTYIHDSRQIFINLSRYWWKFSNTTKHIRIFFEAIMYFFFTTWYSWNKYSSVRIYTQPCSCATLFSFFWVDGFWERKKILEGDIISVFSPRHFLS